MLPSALWAGCGTLSILIEILLEGQDQGFDLLPMDPGVLNFQQDTLAEAMMCTLVGSFDPWREEHQLLYTARSCMMFSMRLIPAHSSNSQYYVEFQ